MNQKPFVSIVTPVHNTEEYLAECIESVLSQTYTNWEYIIVNNCSTDDSARIANSYAEKDQRIRIINTEQLLPQAENYNYTLKQISPDSKYCKMVQADDGISPDCLQEMVSLAESDSSVAIVGAYQQAGSFIKGQGLHSDGPEHTSTIIDGKDACRLYLLQNKYLFGTPSSVLYRSDIIRDRDKVFLESGYHEDSEFCFEILDQFKFGFIFKILSYTRIDNESISTKIQIHNPDILHAYIIMNKYGKKYLSSDEYAVSRNHIEKVYYKSLAWNVFHRNDKDFWNYHENGLKLSGFLLNWKRLYLMQIGRFFNIIGNPLQSMKSLAKYIQTV